MNRSPSFQGRFTSPDSFGGLRVNPQSLNLFAYVNNNPLRFIDPTGHLAQDPVRPNPNKPCSEQDPCDADDTDTIVTITEAPYYIPSDDGLTTDWWQVLVGNMSITTYFSNYDRYLNWKRQEGARQGKELTDELEKMLQDPGVQFALMHFGTALSVETQLEAGSIRLINKGFPSLKGTTTNCVNCAVAVDAMLAGRPASALPGPVQSIAVLEKEFGTTFSAPTTLAKIEAEFTRLGNGARGVVFGENVAGGAGHVVNVVNQGGTSSVPGWTNRCGC